MQRFATSTALLIPVLSLLAFAHPREAAALTTTCVSSGAALQSALSAAQGNNDDNYIKVVANNYALSASINAAVTGGHSLTVEGGYAAGCASAPTAVPDNTTLTGASGLSLRLSATDGTLMLRNFTLTGFKPPAGTSAIALYQNGYGGTLHVENVAATGNTVAGINDDVLLAYSQGGLAFDDNIIHDNPNANAALHIVGFYSSLPFTVANNTVVNNVGPGLLFDVYTFLPNGLYNNILWGNGNDDLEVGNVISATSPLALNNTWLNCSACSSLSTASANNSTANPKLTSNYRLGSGSPAINGGVPLPLALPSTDAANSARVVGSAPDQGAYESSTDDLSAHTYVVLGNGDDAGNVATLRGAITAANAAGVPARIKMDSALNGCPMEIDLATPLPAITVPMVIDGYDSNSAINTGTDQPSQIQFNATLCTVLVNTGVATANALSVAASAPSSMHLEVRGIRFANFGTAVNLAGGNGHWIHGNAFAAASIAVIGNGVGVNITGGQADVIGGPAAADVNLIGGSKGAAAVMVQGTNGLHTILNNSIGADPADSGTTYYANANNGIELVDASQDTIIGNMIFNNLGDGIRIDNSGSNMVTGNAVAFSTGSGVRLLDGAASNFIGATSNGNGFADASSNLIAYNSGPGVWIDLSAGIYNQVAGNAIGLNGGLAIDLALQGPTANVGSENSGPNGLLHKPVLTSALDVGGSKVQVTGTIATAAPNTYRYLTLYASGTCGGNAETMLTTFVVQSGSDSVAHFSVTAPHPSSSNPIFITATDDDYTAGISNTSEISNSRMIKPGDDIFYDGFDCY